MIGQERLQKIINQAAIDTFPKSTILLGKKGCGKHLLLDLISKKLSLELIDMTEQISDSFIDAIYTRAVPFIYFIDMTKVTKKNQNVLLKFVEEPLNNSFIILLVENKNSILPTLLNRCVIYEFDSYTKAELESFIVEPSEDKELLLKICDTPGKIKTAVKTDLKALEELCLKIIEKINVASFPNTLTISDRLNYKDDYDKFDISSFFELLLLLCFSRYLETDNKRYYKLWKLTREYKERLGDSRLNKQHIVENFLARAWRESRE